MIENLEQTFRWFGPADPVPLRAIRQTGATGIVTALHHIPSGVVWTPEEILKRKTMITNTGLTWTVVESVNIHEDIKTGGPARERMIENYITTLENLAAAGLYTVCYNFMPVLDWTRTHLDYRLPNQASALRYHAPALAAFDLYILEREAAFDEYTAAQQQAAKNYLDGITGSERQTLIYTILAGLPGTDEVFTIPQFKAELEKYQHVGQAELKANLRYFLQGIIPTAEKLGIRMCIHPDDPPFPILGLPRVVCNEQDLTDVIQLCPSPANGITFCTGSLGANPLNDLPGMVERLGAHIHFLHLRNVQREADGSFYEAEHLNGSTNMPLVMKNIVLEQQKRKDSGRTDIAIPMRPDHGHKLWTDFDFDTYPGYSLIGRLKGLAELRGLEMGIKQMLNN
jgi:mannonate dehydratase